MSRGFSLPGGGFVVLSVGMLLIVVFLGWGLSTPLLDRVWELSIKMEHAGFDGLEDDEVRDLEAAIQRFPALGRDTLGKRMVRIFEPTDGRWSALARQHLLVSEAWRGDQTLQVSVDLAADALPLELQLTGPGVDETLEIVTAGQVTVPLQLPEGDRPILLKVRMSPTPPEGSGEGIRFDALEVSP